MKTAALITTLFIATTAMAQEQAVDDETYFPQQLTAKELLTACASSSMSNLGRQRRKFCEGFISGVEETLRLQAIKQPATEPKRLCVHQGKSARNFADMYIAYASKRKSLDAPAASIVMEALQSTYPCQH